MSARAWRRRRSTGGWRGAAVLRHDAGSAAVASVLWMGVLAAAAIAALLLSSVYVARTRAATAADLAALAGAATMLDRPQEACPAAAHIAAANGAELRTCQPQGVGVRVAVSAPVPAAVRRLVPGRGQEVWARAHAELRPRLGTSSEVGRRPLGQQHLGQQ